MQINWNIIVIVAFCAVVLLIYLIVQNFKDKKAADKDFKSVEPKVKKDSGYETNNEEI